MQCSSYELARPENPWLVNKEPVVVRSQDIPEDCSSNGAFELGPSVCCTCLALYVNKYSLGWMMAEFISRGSYLEDKQKVDNISSAAPEHH